MLIVTRIYIKAPYNPFYLSISYSAPKEVHKNFNNQDARRTISTTRNDKIFPTLPTTTMAKRFPTHIRQPGYDVKTRHDDDNELKCTNENRNMCLCK